MQEYAPGIIRDRDAYARVGRVGRWTWRIELIIPMMWPGSDLREVPHSETWTVLGRKRALRKARRIVNQHIRNNTPPPPPTEMFEVRHGD